MQPDYLALAAERVAIDCKPHAQVESFGYDFREWISPFTKGANRSGGVALVLQDWASVDLLSQGVDPDIQEHGRSRTLRTNRRLETLLRNVLGLTLNEVYVTNAFPFIKHGAMDAPLRLRDVEQTVRRFTLTELELAQPVSVFALGRISYTALTKAGRSCIRLPHPAARIGCGAVHEKAWRAALAGTGLVVAESKPESASLSR